MPEYVYLNDALIPKDRAAISIYDHGFLYGDGVFEGIRVYNGRIFRLDEHLKRLYRSAKAVALEIRLSQPQMKEAIIQTVQANGMSSGYIRVSVSRGVGLGLDPSHIDCTSTVVVSTEQLSLYPASMYTNGLDVITASTRVPPAVCIDPQIKSLGRYINNIMAKMEANRMGAGEALMLNMEGNVAEATGDNVFLVIGGELITPPTSQGALPGITRATVIECAANLAIPFREAVVTLFDCYNADEAFLTGTAAEVIPMVRLDGRTIGHGKPGPITNRLIEAFRAATQTQGVEV